jgi:uncharacterized protein (DUF1330 family)
LRQGVQQKSFIAGLGENEMAAYFIVNYSITNPSGYKPYVPAVIPILQAHDAEILVADYESEALEGEPGSVTVVAKFKSKEALRAWYDCPEYQAIVHLRTDNSEGTAAIAGEFDLEHNMRVLEAL